MPFSLFITWIIALVFSFICGIWVFKKYKETKSERVGYFAYFLLTGVVGMAILITTFYFTKGTLDPPFGPWAFLIGAVTKTVGLSFLMRLLISFVWPKAATKIFWTSIVVLTIFTVFGLNSLAGTKDPMPSIVQVGAVIFFVALLTIPALWIILLSSKSKEKVVKYRGLLLGIGFLFFGVSIEGAFGFAGLIPLYFQNTFVATGTIFFFGGMIWTMKKEKPEVLLPPQTTATYASNITW